MTRSQGTMWLAAAVISLAGCNKPQGGPGPGPTQGPSPSPDGTFTTREWEDLTTELLDAGNSSDVGKFKEYLSPDTRTLFEKIWKDVVAKIDVCLDSPGCAAEDKARLAHVKQACTWESFVKSYRPGRLVTINPTDDGRYEVTEVTTSGRKLSYLVETADGHWRVVFEPQNRWVVNLEKALHTGVDRTLDRNNLTAVSPAPGAP